MDKKFTCHEKNLIGIGLSLKDWFMKNKQATVEFSKDIVSLTQDQTREHILSYLKNIFRPQGFVFEYKEKPVNNNETSIEIDITRKIMPDDEWHKYGFGPRNRRDQ